MADQVTEIACDVLVCGAGLGGVAAALRAARLGLRVCLTEETGWPGGQISTQGVSALDEHRYIETFGGTASYYELRNGIRAYYASTYRLSAIGRNEGARFNPGNAWVSALSFEPRAGAAVLEAMMSGPHDSGTLQVFYHTRAVAAEVFSGRIDSVLTRDSESGALIRFRAAFVLDATDFGDLYPLTATLYSVGAEARAVTREPSAPDTADPSCFQHLTFPFAVEFRPGEAWIIDKPDAYDENRTAQPYTFVYATATPGAPAYLMFGRAPGTYGSFWTYRRCLDLSNFDDPRIAHDVSIINWSANDYRGSSPVDQPAAEQARIYRAARLLSLGFLYWLQTEAPRDDGGTGYPELKPRPDIMGSADGLSQQPYIREGRRLRALETIYEQNVSAAAQTGARALIQPTSAGIGWYTMDLHGCGPATKSIPTKPFQLPLGTLIPVYTANLLAAGKCIGTTHLTNGAYRLHPTEWAAGEAAAVLAAFCLREHRVPRDVHNDPRSVLRLQSLLLDQGIPLYWYVDVPLTHPAFAGAQLLAVADILPGAPDSLEFRPDDRITGLAAKLTIGLAAQRIADWGGTADPSSSALQATLGDAMSPMGRAAAAQVIAQVLPAAPAPNLSDYSDPLTRADFARWLGGVVRAELETGRSRA